MKYVTYFHRLFHKPSDFFLIQIPPGEVKGLEKILNLHRCRVLTRSIFAGQFEFLPALYPIFESIHFVGE